MAYCFDSLELEQEDHMGLLLTSELALAITLGSGSFVGVMLCKNKKSGEGLAMKILQKAVFIKLR